MCCPCHLFHTIADSNSQDQVVSEHKQLPVLDSKFTYVPKDMRVPRNTDTEKMLTLRKC